MMKHKFKLFTASLMIGLMTLSISCKEQFTEEEALNAQQLVDFAMFVYNESSEDRTPVAGATVTFIQGNNKVEATTDESGVASFPDVKFGGFVYTISAENFTPVTDNEYIYADDLRTSQETYSVGIYSTTDETLATLKGMIQLETDLTNDTRETLEGITLRFRVNLNNGNKVFMATTDANGNYEAKVPVNSGGSTVYVQYPDMLIGQKIAYNKLESDPLDFPEVLPKVETIETLFAMYDGNRMNYNIPNQDVYPMYAIADPAPAGQETAVIDYVETNDDGEIIAIYFDEGGNYSGDADGIVNVTFTSLLGGSGATLQITLGDQTDLEDAYDEDGTAEATLVGGTGYPDDNYRLNRTGYRGPSLDNSSREHSFYLYPGTITFNSQDYGTGVARPDQLEY